MSILVSEPSAFQPVSPALHRTAQYTALIFLAFAGFVAENFAIFAAFVRVFANLFAATFGPFALALAVLVFAMVMGYNKLHKRHLDSLVETYKTY
ncbi:MAG: hypothetical protein LBF42_02810, partial [Puniceicoccales bacterium]|jgi:hypothetical protein|nr:hypothetical protein [Puniceicoccales bacterium]